MLEKDLIQTRGFHNIVQDGVVTGFQFEVRLTYYRGIFLSQLSDSRWKSLSKRADCVEYQRKRLHL